MNNTSPAKDKRHVIYITLMMFAVLVFVMFMAINFKISHGDVGRIVKDVISLIVTLGFINYWYFKSEKFFSDPYDTRSYKKEW